MNLYSADLYLLDKYTNYRLRIKNLQIDFFSAIIR